MSEQARCCTLWLVLEGTNKKNLVRWPFGALVARRHIIDPPTWCRAATTILYGGCGDPLPLWRSYLVENGIKVTVVEFTEET